MIKAQRGPNAVRLRGFTPHACKHCNRAFLGYRNAQYCSDSCSTLAWRDRTGQRLAGQCRRCDVCHAEFIPRRRRQLRCSYQCRVKMIHRRKAAQRKNTDQIQSHVIEQGQRALYRSVMALCSVCHVPGPKAKLLEHGLLEHGCVVQAEPWPDRTGIYAPGGLQALPTDTRWNHRQV